MRAPLNKNKRVGQDCWVKFDPAGKCLCRWVGSWQALECSQLLPAIPVRNGCVLKRLETRGAIESKHPLHEFLMACDLFIFKA